MIETIINDINYRLDEDNLTAEVMENEGYEGDVIIPETVVFNTATYRVTSIRQHAFRKCTSLTSITLPDSIATIARGAFNGCSSLTSIVVVDGNTVYDSREKCNAIIETGTNTLIRGCQISIIPNGITSIGKNAFGICNTLISIIIPDGVTSIEAEAFRYCESLKSITIPASVENIGGLAFNGCKSLTKITFQGTIAQWNQITLGEDWRYYIPATVVHCTDGDVKI